MEFAEVREYAPGDEVRTIDWNVTARMGAPYVKKFVEERDLTLLLVVDVSGSQQFGSQYLLKTRLRGRARGGARLLGGGQPRPGRRRALLRPDRGLRAPGRAAATTPCASCATCWPGSRVGRGHRPRGRAALRPAGACAAAASSPSSPTSRPRATRRRSARCAAATTWWRCTCATRARATCPRPASWPSRTPRRGSGWWPTPRAPEVRRALRAPAFEASRAVFKKTRVDALALGTGESYERPLSGFFKARERRR